MTIKVWDESFDILMMLEGGYVNNVVDKGGETKYGISKKAYPDLDIANLTKEMAKQIYYTDYWYKCKCDYMPDALSLLVFDFAVNAGVKQASKILQRCLKVTADGIIGNQTIGACNSCNVKQIIDDYTSKRIDFYLSIVDRDPFQKRFLDGWIKRATRVQRICEGLCLNK